MSAKDITFEWACVAKIVRVGRVTRKPIIELHFAPDAVEVSEVGCMIFAPEDCSHGFEVGKRYAISLGDPATASAAVPPKARK